MRFTSWRRLEFRLLGWIINDTSLYLKARSRSLRNCACITSTYVPLQYTLYSSTILLTRIDKIEINQSKLSKLYNRQDRNFDTSPRYTIPFSASGKINLQFRETISQSTVCVAPCLFSGRNRARERWREKKRESEKREKKKWRIQRIACHEVGWSGCNRNPTLR